MPYDLSKAAAAAAAYRYTVVQCNVTDINDEADPPNSPGWTDHSTRRCYVFLDRIPPGTFTQRQAAARHVGMHEVGHVKWKARSRSISDMHGWWKLVRRASFSGESNQEIEEDYAECFSRCRDYQATTGYVTLSPHPTSTEFMRICPSL